MVRNASIHPPHQCSTTEEPDRLSILSFPTKWQAEDKQRQERTKLDQRAKFTKNGGVIKHHWVISNQRLKLALHEYDEQAECPSA